MNDRIGFAQSIHNLVNDSADGLSGDAADRLMQYNFDPGALRPWKEFGKAWISVQNGVDSNGQPKEDVIRVANANATLTKEEWIELDTTVLRVARQRLILWNLLNAEGLGYQMRGGMGATVLQHQTVSDMTAAQMNMDGITETATDRPVFDLTTIPLPITHKDFTFTARELASARNTTALLNMPLDLVAAETAARKVAEGIETLTIGTAPTYTWGGGTVYGMINYPSRMTYTMTRPDAGGWVPQTTVNEILQMIKLAQTNARYGPFILLHSLNWMPYLESDYATTNTKLDVTLMERISRITAIKKIQQVDYLNRSNFDMILLQPTSDVCQVATGMGLTTLQWDSHGGLRKNFKVMMIGVPRFRKDFNGSSGLVHGATA